MTTVILLPISVGYLFVVTWITLLSCMLVLFPILIWNTSPLITVPNQTEDRVPISTSPIIVELGAIKRDESIFGSLFLNGNIGILNEFKDKYK